MPQFIRETPYANPLTGLSNDVIQGLLGYMKDKQRTQQMQGLASLLESTGIPKTVERAAYAESPTGLLNALTNVNRANVPLLKPETADALMNVAPMVAPATRAMMQVTKGLPVGASIKDVGQQGLLDIAKRDASDIFGAGSQRVRYTDPRTGGSIEVLARPDNTASVLGLEVPETFRGQGIGGLLQSRVLQDFPDMQGQVSSKAAATTAYRLGRRPPNMPDATLDDVYKMIDENSSVNLVSPQMQQRIAPTPETGLLGQEVTDYRGSHQAPNREFGATLDDLTGGGEMYPADVYSPKGYQYYGTGNSFDKKAFDIANKFKGKPDAMVEIYRAVPKNVSDEINAGDWVTLTKEYAIGHGEGPLKGDFKIIKKKVKASDIYTNADSIHEWGYDPQ
jgi:predicted GNAT family acetyltransferase